MDCEKFEPLLLDELYEELDEVTSAAVKRHVSGCARCSSILSGMRSTRRAISSAQLPLLEMPDGLEDRILSSVKEAQKVVPIQSRAARALSWAGNWAMRPQTAMAAVFLLMIGTSAFVIRSRHAGPGGSGEQSAAVSVTEKGEPAGQTGGNGDHDSLDTKSAANAHGANLPTTLPPAIVAQAPSPSGGGSGGFNGIATADPYAAGPVDGLTSGKGRGRTDESKALGSSLGEDSRRAQVQKDKNAEPAKEEARAEKKLVDRAPNDAISNAGTPGAPAGAPAQEYAPNSQSVAPPLSKTGRAAETQDGFSSGMAAYRARRYAEATRQFDAAASTGDQNSALWAATSVRDGNGGCAAAIPRFDAVTARTPGSWLGNQAMLDSARCQITIGQQLDVARDKLTRLSSTTTHGAAAQQALRDLNGAVATRREAPQPAPAKADKAGSAPARAPATPTATSTAAGF